MVYTEQILNAMNCHILVNWLYRAVVKTNTLCMKVSDQR